MPRDDMTSSRGPGRLSRVVEVPSSVCFDLPPHPLSAKIASSRVSAGIGRPADKRVLSPLVSPHSNGRSRGLAMAPAEWLLLKLAAERIGAARLLPAWREGALRSVPSKAIAQEALRIGAAKLNQSVARGNASASRRQARDGRRDRHPELGSRPPCARLRPQPPWLRLSGRGRRRLIEYRSVKARLDAVERLEREARAQTKRPKATKRDREKEAARVEAARFWREKEAERARVGAERAAEWLAREAERKAEEAKRAAEERAREAETPKAMKRGRGRPRGQLPSR